LWLLLWVVLWLFLWAVLWLLLWLVLAAIYVGGVASLIFATTVNMVDSGPSTVAGQ
jgi:hypothetical protein